MSDPIELKDHAAVAHFQRSLADSGWTFKARFIDKNPGLPLLGVRFTNAERIFEHAHSIQIFDRATVTVQYGFTNDQSVSFTEEDGRELVAWMRDKMPDLLGPIWDYLPEAGGPEALAAAGQYVDLDKAQLVNYLIGAYPELFGRNGLVSQGVTTFHGELLKLVKDPARDDVRRFGIVQAIENLAHDLYADANALLRQAAGLPHAERGPARLRGYGSVVAAERAREYAATIRQHMELQPPPQAFPEAITLDAAAIGDRYLPDPPASVPVEESAPAPPAPSPRTFTVGDIVSVMDAQHPLYRQMGRVQALLDAGHSVGLRPDTFAVQISGQAQPQEFRADQLMKLA